VRRETWQKLPFLSVNVLVNAPLLRDQLRFGYVHAFEHEDVHARESEVKPAFPNTSCGNDWAARIINEHASRYKREA